jgi:hypothetical protein
MKVALIFIGFLMSVTVHAKPVNCDDAPEKAKIELPSPIDQWAVIFCSPKGHVMGAIDGTLCLTDTNSPFLFHANPNPNPNPSKYALFIL